MEFASLFMYVIVSITVSILSFVFFLFKLIKNNPSWCCKCDTCQSFVSCSWTEKFNNLPDWYSHLLQNSPTSTIHIHILNHTITANPKNVEYILKSNFENYPKGNQLKVILGDLLGNGIFLADGDSWKFQRKIASFELGTASVRSYAYEILASTMQNRLIPLLSSSSGEEVVKIDLQDVFRRFSFDHISQFSFGVDPGCLDLSLPLSEFAQAFDLASRLSAERGIAVAPFIWKTKRMLNIGSEKMLKEAIKKVNLLADVIIKERRKLGFSNNRDLLSRFMASITDDDKYLRDIVISFLLAGRDTVASGLTVLFYLMAKNPHVVSRIREESDKVLKQDHRRRQLNNNNNNNNDQLDQIPSFDELKQLHYLHATLYEALRLYPPVQIDSKFAKNDDVLPDGTFIKKGTRVAYHPYAMGRMEEIWGSDRLEFKPERWLQEDGVFCPQNLYKYPVFQAGTRTCLGKEVSLLAMKSVAFAVVQRFDIKLMNPEMIPRFVPGLSATLKDGLPVIITQRSSIDSSSSGN